MDTFTQGIYFTKLSSVIVVNLGVSLSLCEPIPSLHGLSKELLFSPLQPFSRNQIPQQVNKQKLRVTCLYQYPTHCLQLYLHSPGESERNSLPVSKAPRLIRLQDYQESGIPDQGLL